MKRSNNRNPRLKKAKDFSNRGWADRHFNHHRRVRREKLNAIEMKEASAYLVKRAS